MDEKNITLQALEDQNKGERSSNVEKLSVEGELDQSDDTPNPVKVSPEDASTEQSHSDEEAALVQESHIASTMNTAEVVTEAALEQEPWQVIEAAQKLEKEDNGLLSFDLNQEGTSVPALDLNTASPGFKESPRKGKRSGSRGLNIDLNRYSPSPPASPLQSSYSSSPPPPSSSSPPTSVESFDKNDTENPHVRDESLLHASEPEASFVRIMGKNVEIKQNDAIYLFGVELGRRSVRESGSPSSVVDPPPVSVCSSTSGKKRKGPESDLEPNMDAKKKANFSCSTVGKKRKGPESGLEPNMDAKKKANSSCSTADKAGREPEGNILGMAERGACSPSAAVEPPLVSLSCANSSGGMKRKEPESGSEAYVAKKKRSC